MKFKKDIIVFRPDDVDLTRSPLKVGLHVETYVLGAFNPGLTKLPGGNLLIMVRVAEALKEPIFDDKIHTIRWSPEGYQLDGYALNKVGVGDPRKFSLKQYAPLNILALTSLSWLLPVELSPDGTQIIHIHYNKAIAPQRSSQEYGIEDARISMVEGKYYMTTCTVSSERHATTLFTSENGLDYEFAGIILDHQNKDMLIFEGLIGGKYRAITRPLGSLYFPAGLDSNWYPGPAMQLASSPDLFHWKPSDFAFIRAQGGHKSINRIGGGTPPILTDHGWLLLYHAVETRGEVGIYRTYWALLDKEDPHKILHIEDQEPVLESKPELTAIINDQIYLHDVVFTTGIVDAGDFYIVASGELDLACRITHIPKKTFDR